ncbi:hypothetical protein [Mycobacterium sp. 1245805.9]|nr:hypothetical protein [Mycobacterium sp. 1245805.9]
MLDLFGLLLRLLNLLLDLQLLLQLGFVVDVRGEAPVGRVH